MSPVDSRSGPPGDSLDSPAIYGNRRSGTAKSTLPRWAINRVSALVTAGEQVYPSIAELACRVGMSKSLTRRCVRHIRKGTG